MSSGALAGPSLQRAHDALPFSAVVCIVLLSLGRHSFLAVEGMLHSWQHHQISAHPGRSAQYVVYPLPHKSALLDATLLCGGHRHTDKRSFWIVRLTRLILTCSVLHLQRK
jgi:hypothetical protein